MIIRCGEIVLRDMRPSDIEDEIRWMNTDTAWFYADTPWAEPEPVDPDELRRDMLEIISGLGEETVRQRLEIEVGGRHVGMVCSYDPAEASCGAPGAEAPRGDEEGRPVRALGIEIFEKDFWGRGIGTRALAAFMDYYRQTGEDRFLLETWSGNARMLACARKLGFREVRRQKGVYTVDGKKADAVLLAFGPAGSCES